MNYYKLACNVLNLCSDLARRSQQEEAEGNGEGILPPRLLLSYSKPPQAC
jgi:hypothetical protein